MPRHIILGALFYAVIGIGGGIFVLESKNVEVKRRVFPWYLLITALAFLLFLASLGFGWVGVLVMSVFVAAISFLNLSRVRFCTVCGRTSWGDGIFGAASHCAQCGAPLSEN